MIGRPRVVAERELGQTLTLLPLTHGIEEIVGREKVEQLARNGAFTNRDGNCRETSGGCRASWLAGRRSRVGSGTHAGATSPRRRNGRRRRCP